MNKKHILRWVLTIATVALVVFSCIRVAQYFAPGLMQALKEGNTQGLESYIEDAGWGGGLLLFLIQFLQIITIVIPGTPIHIVAGAIYGTIFGGLICMAGFVAANMVIFLAARKIGSTLSETMDIHPSPRFQALMDKAKNPILVILLACLIPLIPNGSIPYLAAQTDMDWKHYLTAVVFGCIPGIFIYCAVGDLIIQGNLTNGLILIAVVVFVAFLVWLFRRKIMLWLEYLVESGKK